MKKLFSLFILALVAGAASAQSIKPDARVFDTRAEAVAFAGTLANQYEVDYGRDASKNLIGCETPDGGTAIIRGAASDAEVYVTVQRLTPAKWSAELGKAAGIGDEKCAVIDHEALTTALRPSL